MRKFIVLLVASIFLLALTAGCGNKQEGKQSSPQQQQSSSTATAKKKVVIASDTAYAPFEFQDQKTGKYEGFDMDIIRAVCEINNWEPEIRSMNFDGIVPALETGSVDMAISAMTITDKRKEKVNFSVPYYVSNQSVMVRADNNTIKSFADLEGKKIGVQIATTGADEARKVKNAKITDYNTINEAFMALVNGNIDAVVNDYPVNYYYIKQGNSGKVKIVDIVKTNEAYGIAVPKSKPEILEKVNAALQQMKQNGKYAEIYKKWFDEDPPAYLPGELPKN